jgi:hypothetical protein
MGSIWVHIMVGPKDRWFSSWNQWFFMVKNWATVPKNGWYLNATITGSLNKHQTQAEVPEVWFLDPLIFGIPIMGTYLFDQIFDHGYGSFYFGGPQNHRTLVIFNRTAVAWGAAILRNTAHLWAKTWVCVMRLPVSPHMTGHFGIFWNVKPTIFGGLIAFNSTCQWSDQWLSCN